LIWVYDRVIWIFAVVIVQSGLVIRDLLWVLIISLISYFVIEFLLARLFFVAPSLRIINLLVDCLRWPVYRSVFGHILQVRRYVFVSKGGSNKSFCGVLVFVVFVDGTMMVVLFIHIVKRNGLSSFNEFIVVPTDGGIYCFLFERSIIWLRLIFIDGKVTITP
jgi:hypothetical protein